MHYEGIFSYIYKMKKILFLLFCLPMFGFGQSWEINIGNNLTEDFGFSILELNSGYLAIGSSESNTNTKGIVSKVDINGNVTSTFNMPIPNPNRKLEKVVDMLGRETKFQTNTPFIEIYDDGTVEKKIITE